MLRTATRSPNFSIYAEATENLFMPWTMAALDEHGVPIQIAKKLSSLLDQYDLDRTIQDLRALDVTDLPDFTDFERKLVASVQGSI